MQTERNEMLQMRYDKLAALVEKGRNPYAIERFDRTNLAEDITTHYEDFEGKTVRIAGRVMGKRGHGKVAFIDLRDPSGKIQSFLKLDELGEKYEDVKLLDIGDIVGIEGEVFRTKMGEISVKAQDFCILSKSLQILPEKFHGLKDVDLRYRKRYVDLIVNPEVKDVFLKRTKILRTIRAFLDARDFIEVETPILGTLAGGAAARPFITHHNTLGLEMFMRIAPELYLKRLIVGGFDRVYEMGRMFRNEGMDVRHNPEYTMIEIYQSYVDVDEMMRLTENLFATVAEAIHGTTKVVYQGKEIDFTPPWRRIDMTDAVREATGIDFHAVYDDAEAIAIAREKGLEVQPNFTRGHVINEFFEAYVEKTLDQPTFVTGHPVEISPLAKKDPADPRRTRRFEAFANTWELANAFSELNDPIDQRERFEEQVRQKSKGDDEAHPMDTDFLEAIEVGLPPTGGLGIGVDRMVMLMTDQPSIRDVLLFPTMKPMGEEAQDTSLEPGESGEQA